MESLLSMRILNPRNFNFTLNHQISPRFFPKSHSLTLTLTPTLKSPSIKSFSSNSFNSNSIFRPTSFTNSSQLGFFFSLSSSNSQFHFLNLNHRHNHGQFYHWHRASPSLDGVSVAGKREVVAVILGWLGATPKHLRRYAEMYNSRGIDAVTFVVPVRDVLWLDLGRKVENRIQQLANELVSWLSKAENGERCLIFHTFSNTGWLVYGAILAHLQERPDLIQRVKGCVVDSGGDPELNPKVWAAGFTAALLKKRNNVIPPSSEDINPSTDKNKLNFQDKDPLIMEAVLLAVLEKMFSFLLKFPDVNQRLLKIISLLSDNQPPCPQLYLYSTEDKVIPFRSVESFIEYQKMKGRTVCSFNFGSSPHVDHYRTFPDVYTSQVNSFLNDVAFKKL
ncbi:Transmembrane protein 53 [Bienertia sinuspersici]